MKTYCSPVAWVDQSHRQGNICHIALQKPQSRAITSYCPVANRHAPVKPQMTQGDLHQNISHNYTSSCKHVQGCTKKVSQNVFKGKHVQRMHQNVSQNDNKFFSKHVQRMYQNVRMIQVQTCTEDAHTQPTQTRA